MASPFESPAIRYGTSIVNAAIIAGIALFLLDGTVRWVALAVAAFELVLTPQILKRAA